MSHISNRLPLLWWTVLFFLFGSDAPLWFDCLRVVLLDIAFSQHRPAHVVAHFDGFAPSQFDWVSTDGVHPFDGLLSRWEIVEAVGLT